MTASDEQAQEPSGARSAKSAKGTGVFASLTSRTSGTSGTSGTSRTLPKEAAIVAGVLFAFGFCGMYFFLRESLEKSLFIGLTGGAIGTFRFMMRAMIKRR